MTHNDDEGFPVEMIRDSHLLAHVVEAPLTRSSLETARTLARQIVTTIDNELEETA